MISFHAEFINCETKNLIAGTFFLRGKEVGFYFSASREQRTHVVITLRKEIVREEN